MAVPPRLAAHRPETAVAYRRALTFRDAVFRLFMAVARKEPPDLADADDMPRIYRAAVERARLRPWNGRFGWE